MTKVRSKQQLSKEIDEIKKKCCCAGGSFEDITYVEALSLVSTSTLKPGTLYRITGVHKNKVDVTIPVLYDDGTNSGTTIYLTALTTSEFSTEGWGEFYNPRYDQGTYGAVDGTGVYLYNIWDGDNPDAGVAPSYDADRKIIWGGYVWTNITGDLGTATSVVELEGTDWTKVAYNTTDYAFVIDYIEYDWVNDWILRRRQAEPVIDVIFPFQFWNSVENTQGIVLHGISVSQWGNKFNKDTELGTGLVICTDAYFEFCNFKGSKLLGFNLNNYSFIKDNYYGINTAFKGVILNNYSYIMNSTFDTGAYQYYIQIDNASGQSDMHINNECYQDNIRLSNKSTQTIWLRDRFVPEDDAVISYQKNIVLDNESAQYLECYNGSYQHSVCVLNNSSQSLIQKYSSFQYFMTLDNASTQTLEFNAFSQQYGTINNVSIQNGNIGGILENGGQSYFEFNGALFDYDGNTFSLQDVESSFSSKEIIYKFSVNFNGGAGAGAVGAFSIPDKIIPNEFFISEVIVESSGLSGGVGSYITMGIETDDVDAALSSTTGLVATLSATPIQKITPVYTKSAGVRKIVMAVGANPITAGSCKFILNCIKLY